MRTALEGMMLAAQTGGEQLMRHFGQELAIREKSMAADVVTKADHDSEKAIIDVLTKHFPDYSILSEEAGLIERESEWMFVVDPLDGSHNFILGIPNFTVSITLTKSGETMAAAVHQPLLQRTYIVEKGEGLRLNGNQLHVNRESDITRATVSHIRNYVAVEEKTSALYSALGLRGRKRFLSAWSPAWDFCLLSSGKIEAMVVDIPTTKEMYDFVGGKLMVREAGGTITDFSGKEDVSDINGQFVASNGTALHNELVKILESCNYA